ncbi:MAG: hypothetical protein WAQ33_07860 [Gaiellaceae bacterium]
MTRRRRAGALGALALACLVAAGIAAAQVRLNGVAATSRTTAASPSCQLNSARGNIKHVIYIQFDNTHLLRDNPRVPSDLQQMPHLLNFMRNDGTLLTNDHTVLISHTAGGILSSLTGVYPDRHGQVVSNSNVRFNGTGFQFPSSFGYWTDPVVANAPTVPNMITPTGENAPAPWVPYTRAGCDFGAVATANTVLENTGTGASGDVFKVFGNPSPQFTEAQQSAAAPPGTAARAKAQTDFVGFAIHCAQGSSMCANGQADALPAEPGGYAGYKGLFGAQEIDPILTGQPASVPLTDLLNRPIVDPFSQPGFPGFDGMSAAASLSYTAAMQEHGVPVTFAYISDAHDNHGNAGNIHVAYGPGDAGYVSQLREYDQAFANFFQRLQNDGITKANTLFVFTVDEGDHYAGVQKTNCDGVNVPCVYGTNEVGEINSNIDTLMTHQHPEIPIVSGTDSRGNPIYNFTVHGDAAPTFYLSGNPDATTSPVRNFERATATLTAVNPYTSKTDNLMVAMADRTEMKALHMISGDPLRNPTFAYFADPNYFITDFPSSTCETCINPAFAWNHGDIQPEIATTWLGIVGPGVKSDGETASIWSDHTDVQPTMLTLLGLKDDYAPDGRVLVQPLYAWAVPQTLIAHRETLIRLADVYKQLNAPFGTFAMKTLDASTTAIQTNTAGDSAYKQFDLSLAGLTSQRDALAAQISNALNAAAFDGKALNEQQAKGWIDQAQSLINQASALAGS